MILDDKDAPWNANEFPGLSEEEAEELNEIIEHNESYYEEYNPEDDPEF
jgi:hypothetical protein